MKKILVVLAIIVMFMACDYTKESLRLRPDIEITYLNPVAWVTSAYDTTIFAIIEEIHFVPENSVDCYLQKMVWEYYDEDTTIFFGPSEIAIYGKIEGIVDPASCDTFILYNVPLPLDPVRAHLSGDQSARALLHFVAVSEYYETRTDTATIWFGIYMAP